MNPIYKYSESTIRPVEVEVGKHTVYLRKDIYETLRIDDIGETTVVWTYQEAKMSHEEFNAYSNVLAAQNAVNNENMSNDVSLLISGQENEGNNQLIIMEAIADLYNIIANISQGGTN